MEKQKLSRIVTLLLTFMLAIPAAPVMAAHPATVALTSADMGTADFGGAFTVTPTVSGLSNFAAYDLTILYNPAILSIAPSIMADPTSALVGSSFAGAPIVISNIFPSIGYIRYLVALAGGSSVSLASASQLNMPFTVNPGTTASDYPSPVCLVHDDTVALGGDVPNTGVPSCLHYAPPSHLALDSVGCRAVNGGFSTLAKGLTDPLFCRVTNIGGSSETVQAVYTYRSIGGVTGSVSSAPVVLAAGQFGGNLGFLTGLTVPNDNDIFIVTGTVSRVITLGDGSTLLAPGPNDVFKIEVNT